MNDLDDGAKPDSTVTVVINKLRGKQQQCRTNSFAAAGSQVLANLRDGLDARDRVAPELVLEREKIVSEQFEEFFPVNCG